MNISFWLDEHKGILRIMMLIVFIAALAGPWILERLHVPAQYACTPPTVRLEGDYCGSPMSGFQFLVWFAGGFFYILFESSRGVFPGHPRELMSGLSLLLLLPIFTTLLLMGKESRRLLTINLLAWILAFLITLTVFISQINDPVARLWGLWLYIILAISAIICEITLLKRKTGDP
jgi:hypothetical protein